jgi:hypothetical protein
MMRLTNQRGVSLMLLIIMITVTAAVAIGTVTLLRARHDSYPYQVQSYQALALADAGVQFATRYALDNGIDFTSNPGTYIGSTYSAKNTYSLGNGQFQLRYEPATTCTPGQMGNLYCKGVVGTAAREVNIADFGGMIGKISGNDLLPNPTLAGWQERLVSDWGGPWPGEPVNGWRVNLQYCGVSQYGQGNIWIPAGYPVGTVTVAVSYPPGYDYVTNPLKLARLAVSEYSVAGGTTNFVWDEMCDRSGMGGSRERAMPHWDGTTIPPPPSQSLTPTWNVYNSNQYPFGSRTKNIGYSYCNGPPNTIFGATLWNTDRGPVRMDFVQNEPPMQPAYATPAKYYVGFFTTYADPVTHIWRTVENRFVFTMARKDYLPYWP